VFYVPLPLSLRGRTGKYKLPISRAPIFIGINSVIGVEGSGGEISLSGEHHNTAAQPPKIPPLRFASVGMTMYYLTDALLSPAEVVFYSDYVVFTEIVACLDFDDFEWLD
jgi:hypothetical protein